MRSAQQKNQQQEIQEIQENQNQNQTQENQENQENQTQEVSENQTQTVDFSEFTAAIKKSLISVEVKDFADGRVKVIINHNKESAKFPPIECSFSPRNFAALAVNGINAALNDVTGAKHADKWAEISKFLSLGFLTKSEMEKSLNPVNVTKTGKFELSENAALSAINKTNLLNSAQKSALFTLNNANNEKFVAIVTNLFKVHPSFAELYTAALKEEKEEELNKAKEALNKELEDLLNF
jgi:hypothetical protein